jgi:hypothetical protein
MPDLRDALIILGSIIVTMLCLAEPDRVYLRGEDAVPLLAPARVAAYGGNGGSGSVRITTYGGGGGGSDPAASRGVEMDQIAVMTPCDASGVATTGPSGHGCLTTISRSQFERSRQQ